MVQALDVIVKSSQSFAAGINALPATFKFVGSAAILGSALAALSIIYSPAPTELIQDIGRHNYAVIGKLEGCGLYVEKKSDLVIGPNTILHATDSRGLKHATTPGVSLANCGGWEQFDAEYNRINGLSEGR